MKRLIVLTCLLIWPFIQSQALVIGTSANYPPLASLIDQKNHFTGFEIEIMQAVCDRIKAPCEFRPVIISTITDQLLSRKIDLAIAAIIIQSKPVPGYIFSLPYLASNTQFIVNKQSPINNPADIKNKRVGVRRGSLYGGDYFKNYVLQLYHNQVRVAEYPTMNDLMEALGNRVVDVAFVNAVAADYWYMNNQNQYKLIGSKIPLGNGYGIMANEGQEPLINAINNALQHMLADGSYEAIYSRYFD